MTPEVLHSDAYNCLNSEDEGGIGNFTSNATFKTRRNNASGKIFNAPSKSCFAIQIHKLHCD